MIIFSSVAAASLSSISASLSVDTDSASSLPAVFSIFSSLCSSDSSLRTSPGRGFSLSAYGVGGWDGVGAVRTWQTNKY